MYKQINLLGYRPDPEGTILQIQVPKEDITEWIHRCRPKVAEIRIDDGRTISAEQRKKIYATLRDIAAWCGDHPERLKELFKFDFLAKTGGEYFSLSNCDMTTARLYINHIIEFCIQWGVPLNDLGINRTDDVSQFLYMCLKHKKCCICGQAGETHHTTAIGMGRDRRTYDDSDHDKICLCREHHTEAHKIGKVSFEKKYHVYGIKYIEEDENGEEKGAQSKGATQEKSAGERSGTAERANDESSKRGI